MREHAGRCDRFAGTAEREFIVMRLNLTAFFVSILSLCFFSGCDSGGGKGPVGKIKDEALSAGRKADSFAFADEDFFHDMDQTKDGPLQLTPNQIKGRNMWLVWTGGDDRLWDVLNWKSFGTFDLLKTIS